MNLTSDEDQKANESPFKNSKPSDGLKIGIKRERERKILAAWIKDDLLKNYKINSQGGERTVTASDIMVLFRYKKYINSWAKIFEDFGLQVENVSGEDFYKREEVIEGLNLLKAVAFPSDTVSVYGVLKSAVFGLSDKHIYELKTQWGGLDYRCEKVSENPASVRDAVETLKKLRERVAAVSPGSASNCIFFESGIIYLYSRILRNKAASGSLIKLASIVKKLCDSEGLGFEEAVSRLSTIVEESTETDFYLEKEKPDGMRLMTVHQAKGIESPVVILADMTCKRNIHISQFIDRDKNEIFIPFDAKRSETISKYRSVKDFDAFPSGWINTEIPGKQCDSYSAIEKVFQEQEEKRIEYVACTRAGDYLIIPFEEHLDKQAYFRKLMDYVHGNAECTEKKIHYGSFNSLSNKDSFTGKEKLTAGCVGPETEGFEEYKNTIKEKYTKFSSPYYNKIRMSSAAGEPQQEEGYGPEYGTIVHETLNELIENPCFKPSINKKELKTVFKKHIDTAMDSDIWKRALKADEVYGEFNVLEYKTGHEAAEVKNELLTGSIDLCFKEKNDWVIADYKTNKIANKEFQEKLTEHYTPQLKNYKETFESVTGEKVKETWILFLDTGTGVKVTIN